MKKRTLTDEDLAAAKRLRAIWDEKKSALGLTQEKAAGILGFSTQGAVSHFLNGVIPLNTDATLRFAAMLMVSPTEIRPALQGLLGVPEGGNLSHEARSVKMVDDDDPVEEDEVVVPTLELKLSAGTGRLQWEIEPNGKQNRYRREWIQRRHLSAEHLVTMKVDGDSMLPGLPDGCSVTLDTTMTHIRSGKRHAIDYMGEFFIKRLFRQPDGSVTVRSDNPDKTRHPDWSIPLEHMDALRVLGAIVHFQADTDD
ncbi:LexA family transcriptional regulator [Uliginosibacterium gangwonense]|uniref:LexA family transcriptional regulator n=1 Tax=Uliginosibacterium gangwonense TaxID=392736 RepID=UPI00037F7745|nr:S24 family peptidase [Uliginosibacterium gangwonense]